MRAADLVLLVTSELVTNAINYGAGPIDVRITYIDGVVRIEVSDSDPDTARVVPRTRTAERPGGHGLHIVAALTNRWGTAARAGGKTVWAELDSV